MDSPDAFLVTAHGGAGLTRDQTRSQRFVAPSRGVRYVTDAADSEQARRTAAVLGSGQGAVLCDVAAATAWALPLPPWIALATEPGNVAVAVTGDRNRPRRGDVRGRRLLLPAGHLTDIDGLAVTTPARTWLDCAERVPLPHLFAMGDAVLNRRLATRNELRTIVHWAHRRRGVLNARRALPLLDGRAASPGESLVRAHLILEGIAPPVCNFNVIEGGEWLARVDLAWPAARLIVEYDGLVHLEESQRRSDASRRNILQSAGWQVITLTASDLTRPWLMVTLVRSALNARTPAR